MRTSRSPLAVSSSSTSVAKRFPLACCGSVSFSTTSAFPHGVAVTRATLVEGVLRGGAVFAPEAARGRRRVERRDGETGRRLAVVAAGRHVVRHVRVEERREQLDLAAAGAKLPLAAAVEPDPARLAPVVEVEQPAHAAE